MTTKLYRRFLITNRSPLPILVYLAVALGSAVPYVIDHDGEVVDAAGHGWRTQDLHETTTVVMLFTMLFTSSLALLRWAARRRFQKDMAGTDVRPAILRCRTLRVDPSLEPRRARLAFFCK